MPQQHLSRDNKPNHHKLLNQPISPGKLTFIGTYNLIKNTLKFLRVFYRFQNLKSVKLGSLYLTWLPPPPNDITLCLIRFKLKELIEGWICVSKFSLYVIINIGFCLNVLKVPPLPRSSLLFIHHFDRSPPMSYYVIFWNPFPHNPPKQCMDLIF